MPTKLIQHASHAMGCACLQVAGPAAVRLGRAGALQIAIVQPGAVDRFLDPRDVADPWTTAVTWFPPVSVAFEAGQLAIELDYPVTYHLRANQPYRLLLRAEGVGEAEERFTGIGNIRRPSAPPAGWAPPPDPMAAPSVPMAKPSVPMATPSLPTAKPPEPKVSPQVSLAPASAAPAAFVAEAPVVAAHPGEPPAAMAQRPAAPVAPAPERPAPAAATTVTPGAVSMLAPQSAPPLAPVASARATTQVFCTQCGATLKPGAAFCIGCGARAGAPAAAPAAAVVDSPPAAAVPPAAPAAASDRGGGNTALIVAIVVGVLVVLFGAGLFVAAMIEEANQRAEAEQVRLREERERAEKQAAEARQRAEAEARRRREAEERARQQREAQERAVAEAARQQREAQERAAADAARRQREAQERASLESAQRQQVAAMLAEGERCFAASRFDCAIAHANSALQVIPGEPRAQELRARATENQRRANQGVQIR